MHYCLIYNLNSSSGKKIKLVNKIYEKLKNKPKFFFNYKKRPKIDEKLQKPNKN